MGQTLTHGIYLPDEGERNCYSGLAANWQILDGSVGTIAAHTAALAGKAPLVHTHSKSDITDFPAYGNAAGTICEGNDSRLSDARTPVAHTHTKSDVTDLLNSNFIPSANNSYDLGSSSYQWKSVYAQSYYYNGTAWGLDKSNVWTGTNTFQQNITYEKTNLSHNAVNPCYILKDTGLEKGSIPPAAHAAYPGMWHDKNSAILGYMRFVAYDTGKQTAEIRVSNLIKNGVLDPTGSAVACTVHLVLQPSGEKSLIPEQNTDIDLGTSTNKWKSLNGINPGALSLPDLNTAQTIDRTGWAYDGSTYNSIKLSSTDTNMTKNGWLYVRISSTGSSDKLSIKYNSIGDKYPTSSFGDTGGCIEVFVPIIANSNVYLCATKDLQFCKFYPCQGNV